MMRPRPEKDGTAFRCPVCRWVWHKCDCPFDRKCLAPTNSNSPEDDELLSWCLDTQGPVEIGIAYEEQVAHELSLKGYKIRYDGILLGATDRGIDLLATHGEETLIVQCKCHSILKPLRENVITQLYGTVEAYRRRERRDLVIGVVYTTTTLDSFATETAESLGIEVVQSPFRRDFPRVKLAHDKTYLTPRSAGYYRLGDPIGWVHTTAEAQELGYRRG